MQEKILSTLKFFFVQINYKADLQKFPCDQLSVVFITHYLYIQEIQEEVILQITYLCLHIFVQLKHFRQKINVLKKVFYVT